MIIKVNEDNLRKLVFIYYKAGRENKPKDKMEKIFQEFVQSVKSQEEIK